MVRTLQSLDYPLTEASTRKYVRDVFKKISHQESVTAIFNPLAGSRVLNKFIVDNSHSFKSEMNNYDRYLVVFIESLNLTDDSMVGYLRLFTESIVETCKAKRLDEFTKDISIILIEHDLPYFKLLKNVKEFLAKLVNEGYTLVFFWSEFDEIQNVSQVFFANIKSLWNQFYPNLQFVFLMKRDVYKRQSVYLWGDLNQLILQNVLYVPLVNERDEQHIVQRIVSLLKFHPTKDEVREVLALCGRHPYMMYVAFKELSELKAGEKRSGWVLDNLRFHYAIESASRAIIDVWDELEVSILKKIALHEALSEVETRRMQLFQKLGLVCESGDKTKLFNEVFTDVLLHKYLFDRDDIKKGWNIDEDTGQLTYNNVSVEDKFTNQQRTILSLFISNEDIVVSRDMIGEYLWGSKIDKYSDWSIDQLISKIRYKLKKIDQTGKILTVRGRGYKFTNSEI